MVDRTQEDINQDVKISRLEKEIADLKESHADLAQRLAEAYGMAQDAIEPLWRARRCAGGDHSRD